MPGRDGTGPRGQGPMSGRGYGPCDGTLNYRYGAGYGYGCGRGFGRRAFWGQGSVRSDEEMLAEEKQFLLKRLADIDEQLE